MRSFAMFALLGLPPVRRRDEEPMPEPPPRRPEPTPEEWAAFETRMAAWREEMDLKAQRERDESEAQRRARILATPGGSAAESKRERRRQRNLAREN